jgi:uncharacterized BrkB/YihY/UPF0761 family membrane protein
VPGSRLRRYLSGAIDLYWGSGVSDDVPALAWFLVGGLVPLALGITALASVLLGDYAEAQALAERAAAVLPPDVSDQLVQVVLRTQRDSPLLIAISIVGMVWAASGAVGVIDRSMSRLLRPNRSGPVKAKLRHLALSGGLVLVVVLMFLAASKATDLQSRLGLHGPVLGWLFSATAIAATVLVCASLYRFSAHGGTPWAAAVAGAVPAGLGLQVTPTLVAYYLDWVAGTTPVHVFLVLAGILFTCYLAAVALLVGAVVAVRRDRAHRRPLDLDMSTAAPRPAQ